MNFLKNQSGSCIAIYGGIEIAEYGGIEIAEISFKYLHLCFKDE